MRTRLPSSTALAILLTFTATGPAFGWGFEAHRFIMARAIPLLPPDLRPFFEKHQTTIIEHTIDPDLWRTAGWEQEPPRHFLDLDAYGPYPFAGLPRDYDQAVKQYGAGFVEKNGLLPWRSAEIYGKLVEAFKQESPYARENIKFFTSVLSHYVSDAHVPFHAVVNYDGQLTEQWGIHSRFESELFERYRKQLRVTPGPLTRITSARDVIFDALVASFPLAQQVLDADKAAVAGRALYDDEYFTLFFQKVGPLLERRLADSITASASLIAAAWMDAGRPALPLDVPVVPRKVGRGVR